MFLAPAGNPSSLRFGHPDVATEHTDLSPTNSIPLPVVRGRVRVASGASRGLLGLGRVCAEAGKEGAPAGAKEVYSAPSAHTSKRLKDVQLTTQLC